MKQVKQMIAAPPGILAVYADGKGGLITEPVVMFVIIENPDNVALGLAAQIIAPMTCAAITPGVIHTAYDVPSYLAQYLGLAPSAQAAQQRYGEVAAKLTRK